jgi:formylglycine-generating enzyme required for sulfatase activity
MNKLILLTLFCVLFKTSLNANNIQISNVSIHSQNIVSDFTMVQFDISWENSWRLGAGPSNWDAAWVFIKYRIGTGPWLHALLNDSGHNTGSGTAATVSPGLLNTSNAFNATTNPAMGVFLHRSGNGAGTFSHTGLQLRWNYGANGIADGEAVDIKVFAVEMVYVPQGSFFAGDASALPQGNFRDGATNTPLLINSENALTLGGTSAGNLANNNNISMTTPDDFDNLTTQTLPAAFPKGFKAFYCMKYEITQQQWIDFFNTLSVAQKANRDLTAGSFNIGGKNSDAIINRNNIRWTSGDAILNSGTHGGVGCSFLSWMDGAAFYDWAALRPMSELEFEKACRGNLNAVTDEYGWGSTTITNATIVSNSGATNEITTNVGANTVCNSGVSGPLRVGIFATVSSLRAQAGATYYGIMEMSGNLWERTVTVGNATGRNFTAAIHGNGLLTTDGFCDISSWPGFVTSKVTESTGAGFRGGGWNSSAANLRISDRALASNFSTGRFHTFSIRAVRSAP